MRGEAINHLHSCTNIL